MIIGRRTKFIVLATALIVIAISTIALTSGFMKKSNVSDVPKLVDLNKTITNAMSDTSILAGMDKKVKDYMTMWGLQGVSLSVMRNDSLLFAKGYGLADEEQPMEAGNILRMASVSKLVTAAGIMVLQDRGQLSIKDKVFGPRGILNDSIFNASIKDTSYYSITVEDLMRHKGGFSNRGGDPMFSTRWIMMQNRWTSVPTHDQLVALQLKRPLVFKPGTSQSYSNFGYLALSMVIEHISGLSYEDFIQENLLHPAGCFGFRIAGNYYKDKYPEEVRYFVQKDDEPAEEFNNSGRKVTRCYGGNDVTDLAGAGAWVASTPELALFVASIDGKPEIPDVISKESVAAMTEYFDENTYSLGWNDTKPDGTWSRTGTFAGTSALIKCFPDGECWVFLTNTSTYKGPGLSRFTAALFDNLRTSYSKKLPSRNMFYPEGQSENSEEARTSKYFE